MFSVLARPLLDPEAMAPYRDNRHPAEFAADAEELPPVLMTIRGIVLPTDWDVTGKVAAWSLSGYNEDDYLIVGGEERGALATLMRQEVEVVGIVTEAEGKKLIFVKSVLPCSGRPGPKGERISHHNR